MAVFTTITVSALPTTRTDGTALAPSDLGGVNIYKGGTKYASIAVGASFTDTVAAANGDTYTATVFDTQSPPAESAQSNSYVVAGVVTTLAAPNAPTITGATA